MVELCVLIIWVIMCYIAIDWVNHCNDEDWLYKCEEDNEIQSRCNDAE